ncbi:unnamed protein product [Euphydryas editha]|uniref:Transposase n=1 Tax=Euphydryas editha TaxID=104508 RepID=A0AAU9TUK2_EUPED|nr:unnamed protein product [Euphydryas editha]
MASRIPGQRGNREGILRVDLDRTEVVLEIVQRNPSTSTRAMARALDIPMTSIQAILHDEGYHAFHSRRVQALQPTDHQLHINFCQAMLRKEQDGPGFFNTVLWSDASRFERSGIFNTHNYHTWAIENPHAVRASTFQDCFSVTCNIT